MKNAPNDFEKAVQNGRQLALKISANSVYGFTGAGVGQLPCLPIASSVTSYGRYLLETTRSYVEEQFSIAHGYKDNAKVVYGDTDSVMVKFGTKTVEETFPLAIKAAEMCSNIFPDPILLEFEKVIVATGLLFFFLRDMLICMFSKCSGIFPLPTHEQETLRWAHVDSSR